MDYAKHATLAFLKPKLCLPYLPFELRNLFWGKSELELTILGDYDFILKTNVFVLEFCRVVGLFI